jgi:hypothetical protein
VDRLLRRTSGFHEACKLRVLSLCLRPCGRFYHSATKIGVNIMNRLIFNVFNDYYRGFPMAKIGCQDTFVSERNGLSR